MKLKIIIYIILLISISSKLFAQTTIEQKLIIVENSKTLFGNFKIEMQAKGTNLPIAKTLGSATIDIIYDSTKLRFINGSNWQSSISTSNGYTRFVQSNNESGTSRAVRIGILGIGVNENGGGNPPGYDINSNYESWVKLNFIILNTSNPVSLTIKPVTNQIGLFQNLHNEPYTNIINNQTLAIPIDLINIPLPILNQELISEDYFICNNYPNPFNSETQFDINVKKNTFFVISIFDLSSKLIFYSENLFLSGHSIFKLNMNKFSSGIYLVNFKSKKYSKNFKISYIK